MIVEFNFDFILTNLLKQIILFVLWKLLILFSIKTQSFWNVEGLLSNTMEAKTSKLKKKIRKILVTR